MSNERGGKEIFSDILKSFVSKHLVSVLVPKQRTGFPARMDRSRYQRSKKNYSESTKPINSIDVFCTKKLLHCHFNIVRFFCGPKKWRRKSARCFYFSFSFRHAVLWDVLFLWDRVNASPTMASWISRLWIPRTERPGKDTEIWHWWKMLRSYSQRTKSAWNRNDIHPQKGKQFDLLSRWGIFFLFFWNGNCATQPVVESQIPIFFHQSQRIFGEKTLFYVGS